MKFQNTTQLDSSRLRQSFERFSHPYRHDTLSVHVRDSRGADFSGRCCYTGSRVLINLGPRNAYPYALGTHVAKARSGRTHWWREVYRLILSDAYQLALFIYLHEFYHYLVKAAGRNTRRKEAMCDRFATRVLVDHFNCPLVTRGGRPVRRSAWDISKLDAYVGNAPHAADQARAAPRPPRVAARTRAPWAGAVQPAFREQPVQLLLGFG